MSGSSNDTRLRFTDAVEGGTAFFQGLGALVTEILPGRSTLRLPYAPYLVGNPDSGVVHGGVITGLLDQACGMAATTALARARPDEPMQGVATLDLRIDYLKAAEPGADIVVIGECVKVTRQIVFARGRAFHADEADPIALATGTFMVTALRPAGA